MLTYNVHTFLPIIRVRWYWICGWMHKLTVYRMNSYDQSIRLFLLYNILHCTTFNKLIYVLQSKCFHELLAMKSSYFVQVYGRSYVLVWDQTFASFMIIALHFKLCKQSCKMMHFWCFIQYTWINLYIVQIIIKAFKPSSTNEWKHKFH